jgi:hypothetical protein
MPRIRQSSGVVNLNSFDRCVLSTMSRQFEIGEKQVTGVPFPSSPFVPPVQV